jgi:hypothetical protein
MVYIIGMQRDYKPAMVSMNTQDRNFGRFFEMAVAHTDGSQAGMVAYIRKYDDQAHSLENAYYRAMSDVIEV